MTDALTKLRARIDSLDGRIVPLLEKRLALAAEIGRSGLKPRVRDPRREREVLAKVRAAGSRPFRAPVARIYSEIIRQCGKVQR